MAYEDRNTVSSWRNQVSIGRSRKADIDKELLDAKHNLRNMSVRFVIDAAAIQADKEISNAQKKLQAQYDDLNESIRLEIGRQNERYRLELDKLRKEIDETHLTYESVKRRVQNVNQQLDNALDKIEQSETKRRIRANTYADQLDNMLMQIQSKHPTDFEVLYPDRLVPGSHAIEEALRRTRNSIAEGDYEPAIGIAQTFISHALGYESQLDQLNDEYGAALSETERALAELEDIRNSVQQTITEMQFTINDDLFENDHDIYFWTAGIFGQIEERLSEAVSLMNLGIDTYDVSVLKDAKNLFHSISKQIDECRTIAERQFYLSCLCQETAYMAELVICRDGYSHWKELSSAFLESDLGERGTYQVVLDNAYEATTCLLVSPDRDRNTVICDIEVFDRNGNSVKRDTIRNGILEELRQDIRTSCIEVKKVPYNEEYQTDLMNRSIKDSEREHDNWRGSTYSHIQTAK